MNLALDLISCICARYVGDNLRVPSPIKQPWTESTIFRYAETLTIGHRVSLRVPTGCRYSTIVLQTPGKYIRASNVLPYPADLPDRQGVMGHISSCSWRGLLYLCSLGSGKVEH